MFIRKYQVGGIAYTPYLPAQTGTAQESTSSSSSSSSSSPDKISGTFTDKIIDILKENGIPSDVDKFLSYANNALTKMQSLSGLPGEDSDYDLSDVIKIQSLANKVKFNKGLYDNAADNLTKEMAWAEVAIDNKGYMYAYGEDGLTKITASEYYKNPDKYMALTNSDLLSYRENNGAFDSDILNNIKNAVGMQSITNYLRDIIKNFGKSSIEGYATKDKDAILNGFHNLMTNGPDGYYKAKSENQLNDTAKAIDYLYNALPNNMKQLLRAKTAAEGGNPNSNDIFELIIQALTEHTSYTYSAEFDKSATDFDPQMTGKVGGSASKTSSESLTPDTYLYRVASLNGPRQTVMIAPRGAKINDTGLLVTMGIVNGAVVDGDDKRLGPMSLTHMLQSAEAVKAADASTIVLGNRRLKDSEYGAVMFDGNTECNTVFLPYTTDNGRIVPDFDVFRKFNELQNRISGKFNVPKTEIDRIANEIGLDSDAYNYDSATNSCTLKNTMAFLSFGVIVGDDSIDLTKDDKRFLEKIDRDEAKSYEKAYNNMLMYGKADRKRSDLKVGNYNKSGTNDFYRGLIWMAMPDAYRGTHLSMDELIPKSKLNDFGRRTELRNEQVQAYRMYQESNNGENFASF